MSGKSAQAISNVVSIIRKPFLHRNGLRILMYHSIGGQAYGDHLGIFSLSPEMFRAHVKLMFNNPAIENVPLEPICIDKNKLNVSVTFDDGYLDNLLVAAPILAEHNIPFTVFVSSAFVQKRTQGFLDSTQLRELAGFPGASIGAHGVTHTPLTQCDNAKLKSELHDGKKYLEDKIGHAVTSLAYPHGATNKYVQDEVAATGYQLGVCSQFDINQPGSNPLMLSRTTILRDDNERIFGQKLSGDWDWYRFRNLPHWYASIKYKMK